MFRALLAAALVACAFGAALYFSGDYLQAWENPEPAKAQAAPAPRKKAKRRRHAPVKRTKPARKASTKPAWLTELNALCRRAQDDAAAIPPPITAEGVADYFRQIQRLNNRWNRQAAAVLRRSGPSARAARLIGLFGEEERILSEIVSAVESRQAKRIERMRPRFVALAKSENRLLKGLGARDCTIEDAYDF